MLVARSLALFTVAAVAEIGGAFLVWRAVRDDAGWAVGVLGAAALVAYGVLLAQQPEGEVGRVFAAYGGVFIVGSLLWATVFDDFHADRSDVLGAIICLVGMMVIMFGPRGR
jgi:small multidrug resistance family-3 protein